MNRKKQHETSLILAVRCWIFEENAGPNFEVTAVDAGPADNSLWSGSQSLTLSNL